MPKSVSNNRGKVKNVTAVDAYGLHFRSKLELYTYEAFIKAGIPVKYEPKHFTLPLLLDTDFGICNFTVL